MLTIVVIVAWVGVFALREEEVFIAGVSWPQEMLPDERCYLSYFFPYTWGVHGFPHTNSMGATLAGTARE